MTLASLHSPTEGPSGATAPMVFYGLGSIGRMILDELLDRQVAVDLILDRGKRGETYRDIPILALDDVADGRIAGRTVQEF